MHNHIHAWTFSDRDLENPSPQVKVYLDHYSRMKYGSHQSTRWIAKKFLGSLLSTHRALLSNKSIVVIPAPFNGITPAASTMLAKYIYMGLADNNLNSTFDWDIVKRNQNYIANYAKMSAQERIDILAGDKFKPHIENLGNRTLLFIDDVNITGAHGRKIEEMIEAYGMNNEAIIASFAKYLDADPLAESAINHQFIDSKQALVNLSYEPDFEMTLRAINFTLELSGHEFRDVFNKLSYRGKETMWQGMLGKQYHRHEKYTDQTLIIKEILNNEY